MPDQLYLVNAFSSQPFEGNLTGVFVLEKPREMEWMVNISRCLNLVEAAFLVAKSPSRFDMRCIAGSIEVDLGTSSALASAHVLFGNRFADARRSIALSTHAGPISSVMSETHIELNFPALSIQEIEPPEEILQAVDPSPQFVGRRGDDYIIQVSSESKLKKLQPDFKLLDTLGVHGLIITSSSATGRDYDFAVRTFQLQPRYGLDTPVASWAYAALGSFWIGRLGKTRLTGFRHASRSTPVTLEVDGDRVKMFGEAITIFHGELRV
jgi:predicted PhzF superfamily epimerase YddE/YHI9